MDRKKIAIMQPYFFPYIGYFQLINAVDVFVLYDNIQYTKKGWINRNRYLLNGSDSLFTLPLKKDSDFLDIVERNLSSDYLIESKKTINKLREAYKKAPFYNDMFPLIEKCFLCKEDNLFRFIIYSILLIVDYLEIKTKIVISSKVEETEIRLKGRDRVISICKKLNASDYINSIGGMELYSKEDFSKEGIKLDFIKSGQIKYRQFDNEFVPWLSVIDVLMFNPRDEVKKMLNSYELI